MAVSTQVSIAWFSTYFGKNQRVSWVRGAVSSFRSFFFPEMLPNPKLVLAHGTLSVVMKQNVTLSCLSESGSPPVRYTLFKHNQQVSALNRSDWTPALFPLTISSASDLGEYKCKAEYNISTGGKYSNSLNFTLLGTFCLALVIAGKLQVLILIYKKYLKYGTTLHCINFFFLFGRREKPFSAPDNFSWLDPATTHNRIGSGNSIFHNSLV
uniref:Ig-like domain-containing protein n=1 Tax=Malurus cyaneus samueli TaxID=2593467 RepID=A0A8C5TET4_9PASS